MSSIIQSTGAIVLTAAELTPNMLIKIVNPGPLLTVTTLGDLQLYFGGGTGLAVNGVALTLTNATGWPTSTLGLGLGAVWANGIFVAAVPGGVPNPSAPPVFYGIITSTALLVLGATNLPRADPLVLNQLWLNGSIVCVSVG